MTYIDYLNNFELAAEENILLPGDWAVYMRLLQIANKRFWPKRFRVPTAAILGLLGRMSRKGLCASRERLRDAGLIDFREGAHGVELAEYELLSKPAPRPADTPETAETLDTLETLEIPGISKNSENSENSEISENSEHSENSEQSQNSDEIAPMMARLKGDTAWLDRVSVMETIQKDRLVSLIDEFAEHCQVYSMHHESLVEAQRHFFNWLKKSKQQKQQNNENKRIVTYNIQPRIRVPQAGDDPRRGVAADAKKEKKWFTNYDGTPAKNYDGSPIARPDDWR